MGAFLTFLGVVIAIVIWCRRFNRARTTVMTALNTTKSALDKQRTGRARRSQQPPRPSQPPRQTETLEKDPETGVYRVKGND